MAYQDWRSNATGGGIYGGATSGGGGDINAAGAASDPFAYTKGSLLTPWEGKFS